MVQKSGVEPGRWIVFNAGDAGLADAVPILERSLQIPLQEKNRAQEVVGVFIPGLQCQRAVKIFCGLRIVLLLKSHASQFNREAFVARIEMLPLLKRLPGLIPPPQLRQSRSIIEINVRRGMSIHLRSANYFLPLVRVE